VTQSLLADGPATAASLLQQLAAAPDLDYRMAAEILFLIETLKNRD
jgi:hypothetical protein